MKAIKSYVLDEEDKEIIHLFMELGMPANIAKTLLYVSQVEECLSADVEQGANLRQPEVSIAMQKLMERGWVKKRVHRRKGKGRPVNIYRPTKPLSEILKIIEKEKLKEIESIKKDISDLKEIIEKR
jgi:predicted transcriptional regulator